ncbi:hypothetical protein ACQPUZ_04675 [Clostridium tertium]
MSKLTPRELALLTVKDIERRKALKKKGEADADNYMFDMQSRAFKAKSKIRCKTYRGK